MEDKYFSGELDPKIQYASIEQGIKAFAETYSFNIESMLYNQLTKEQQILWKKEIEQAVISGGEVGVELTRDKRYKENLKVDKKDNSFRWIKGILLLTILVVVGCTYKPKEQKQIDGFDIIVVDSCEYTKGYYKLAHKGNCRFCEERDSIKWEKRKKELIEQLNDK